MRVTICGGSSCNDYYDYTAATEATPKDVTTANFALPLVQAQEKFSAAE